MFNKSDPEVKSKQLLGKKGETLGLQYLKAQGFSICECNFRTRFGEIDIIAKKRGEYFFIEVKTRRDGAYGTPTESLPFFRLERFKKMALFYAAKNKIMEKNLHLALLGIDLSGRTPKITFIEDIV